MVSEVSSGTVPFIEKLFKLIWTLLHQNIIRNHSAAIMTLTLILSKLAQVLQTLKTSQMSTWQLQLLPYLAAVIQTHHTLTLYYDVPFRRLTFLIKFHFSRSDLHAWGFVNLLHLRNYLLRLYFPFLIFQII